MKLLVDTDVYCKLSVCDLFLEAVHFLGADIAECGRLAALPHMLRRGRLRRSYGSAECDRILTLTDSMPIIDSSGSRWLERLTSLQSIDPGEAQIFALGAEMDLLVMTGDKRALRSLVDLPELNVILSGRIVVLEAILIALCNHLGFEDVRRRIGPLSASDTELRVIFSPSMEDPRVGLRSYYNDLRREVDPLVLWNPIVGESV